MLQCWLKLNIPTFRLLRNVFPMTAFSMLTTEMKCDGDVDIYTCDSLTNVDTLRPRQNGRHFADDIFKCIFSNENVWILIKISLKFVPKGPINNNPALVQIMAWRRSGDKPLFEPMMVSLLTHICVTRPQWVNLTQDCHLTVQNEKLFYIRRRNSTESNR